MTHDCLLHQVRQQKAHELVVNRDQREKRDERAAQMILGTLMQLGATGLARAVHRWRAGAVAADAHAKNGAVLARIQQQQATISHLEIRPLMKESSVAEERRLRLAAEEACAALELKIKVLQREKAVGPAVAARAELALSLKEAEGREERRAERQRFESLGRLCKLVALGSYLRAVRARRLISALRGWAEAAGALTHAEALHACRQEAERRGYRRALEAALAAERNATAAGKGAEAARLAEVQREMEVAWAEARAFEAARADDAAAAQATRLELEARLRRVEEALAEQAR
jgi:hypothetical protein